MEPYASSTAELVTELLEYQPTEQRLTRLESTVMYAGIIVDTKTLHYEQDQEHSMQRVIYVHMVQIRF